MQAHSIAAIAAPWIKEHPLPDPELQQIWMTFCLQQQARWIRVIHAQTQLINLLEQHNIPCVVIKGTSAMIAYPQPSLRAAGDIDILVKRADYEKAAIILENNEYSLEHDKKATDYHYCYQKNDISFELHKRLATITEDEELALTIFENGIDNREWHTIGNSRFPCLPTDLNGLVLLLHIKQHLKSGLGLRQVIDWMMYLYKNNNFNDIIPLIRTMGLERLANTVTVMCQKYLGLYDTINESEDYPYDELMEYIINNGNFGIKKQENEENRIAYVSQATRNPINLFVRLQLGGLSRWKATKEHKALRPFAWLYQIVFILRELIKNKITPQQFINSQRRGLKQRQLINNLISEADKNPD